MNAAVIGAVRDIDVVDDNVGATHALQHRPTWPRVAQGEVVDVNELNKVCGVRRCNAVTAVVVYANADGRMKYALIGRRRRAGDVYRTTKHFNEIASDMNTIDAATTQRGINPCAIEIKPHLGLHDRKSGQRVGFISLQLDGAALFGGGHVVNIR